MTAKQLAPPLSRQDLLARMVTDADAFTALRYLRQREQTPALWELEQTGEKKLPGVAAALGDTYHALWSEGAALKPSDQVAPSQAYWHKLLGSTMATSAFQQLQAKTAGDALMATLGTIEAGQTIFQLVPQEDAEKLEEIAEAQSQADQLEQAAQEAQADADALQQLMAEMQGSAQAQGLAGKLAQAQGAASQARGQADAANAQAQAKVEALLGQPDSAQAEAKLRELTRLGMAAVQQANTKVAEVSDTIAAWGLDKGELQSMEPTEALGLVGKMRQTPAFEKFAKLLGRLRVIAARKARSKTSGEGRRVLRSQAGSDIARAHTAELVALAHPATRASALQRWASGTLRLRGTETKRELGQGPVIVCEDSSGSMDGDKRQWAKATTLALAHYAKLRQRAFGWVMFDYSVQRCESYPAGVLSARQLLDIAEARSGGGTDFERPLRKAIEMITKSGLKKADILLVTDGDCAVSSEFLVELAAAKARHGFSVITVICDAGGRVSDATVKQFSDRVDKVSSFTAEEAETKVFAHI